MLPVLLVRNYGFRYRTRMELCCNANFILYIITSRFCPGEPLIFIEVALLKNVAQTVQVIIYNLFIY